MLFNCANRCVVLAREFAGCWHLRATVLPSTVHRFGWKHPISEYCNWVNHSFLREYLSRQEWFVTVGGVPWVAFLSLLHTHCIEAALHNRCRWPAVQRRGDGLGSWWAAQCISAQGQRVGAAWDKQLTHSSHLERPLTMRSSHCAPARNESRCVMLTPLSMYLWESTSWLS